MISSSFCARCGAILTGRATSCPRCGYALLSTLPPQTSGPGPLLTQRYRILGKIGEGGFGLVYKAVDRKQGTLVAIKQINLASLTMQQMIDVTDSYNREITLLPQLQHEYLPHVYDHFTDPDHWYIVMEYIDGQTLEEILGAQPAGLPLEKVLTIGIALCDVLAYLHAQHPRIIYRDVKPGNIMLTRNNHLYLIDFGIARRYRAGQIKDTGPLGSPGYAAPEQYGKAQTTPITDIYGLGATLQTLLTGKEPLEIRVSGMPSEDSLPPGLQTLITRMMEPDPGKRLQHVQQVRKHLQYIRKRPVLQQTLPLPPFGWLATLWCLCMFMLGYALFPNWLWLFFLALALFFIAAITISCFHQGRLGVWSKPTRKEIPAILKKGLSYSIYCMPQLLFFSCMYSFSLAKLFGGLQPARGITGLIFVIISIAGAMVIAISYWLPLLKWQMRTARQNRWRPPQAAQTPPPQQMQKRP